MAVPSLSASTARTALRRELRKRRLNLERDGFFLLTPDPDLGAVFARATIVALYLPVAGEPDPLPVLAATEVALALPALASKHALMKFHRWSPGDPLEQSVWGGTQPLANAPTVEPDVILVPLLGFDDAFNRIGQGGGHYDRYLAAHPTARRIGIAWEGQRVPRIAAELWDIPLDAILTEAAFHVKDLNRCPNP